MYFYKIKNKIKVFFLLLLFDNFLEILVNAMRYEIEIRSIGNEKIILLVFLVNFYICKYKKNKWKKLYI